MRNKALFFAIFVTASPLAFANDEGPALEVPVDESVEVSGPRINPGTGTPVIIGSGGSGMGSGGSSPVTTLDQVMQADAARQTKNNKENTEKARGQGWFQKISGWLSSLIKIQGKYFKKTNTAINGADGSTTTISECVSVGVGSGEIDIPSCSQVIISPHEIQFANEPSIPVEGFWRITIIPITSECYTPEGRRFCFPESTLTWVVESPEELTSYLPRI